MKRNHETRNGVYCTWLNTSTLRFAPPKPENLSTKPPTGARIHPIETTATSKLSRCKRLKIIWFTSLQDSCQQYSSKPSNDHAVAVDRHLFKSGAIIHCGHQRLGKWLHTSDKYMNVKSKGKSEYQVQQDWWRRRRLLQIDGQTASHKHPCNDNRFVSMRAMEDLELKHIQKKLKKSKLGKTLYCLARRGDHLLPALGLSNSFNHNHLRNFF